MALQYSPKIVQDGLVMCLDPSQNKSYPTDLPVKDGLIMWLDAADDTTFSYSSGTVVSQWRDKSGLNNHVAQSTVASQPNRNTVKNSRKSVYFDGGDTLFNSGNVFPSNTTNYTKIAVVYQTSTATTGNVIGCRSSTSGSNYRHTIYFGGLNFRMWHDADIVTSSISLSLNTLGIITGTYVNSSGLGSVFLNGTASGTGTAANRNIVQDIEIGGLNGGNNYTGEICEVLVFSRVLSATELKQVHTYLGQKWGISNADRSIIDLSGFDDNGLFGNGSTSNMPLYDYYNKGGLKFDGVNDFIQYPSLLNLGNSFTINFWIKPTSNTRQTIISNGYPYLANKGFFLACPGNNATDMFLSLGNDQKMVQSNTGAITTGAIQMVTAVVNGLTNLMRLYVNGVEVSYAVQNDANVSLQYDSGIFVTGKRDTTSADYLYSNLYALQIYSRGLSATEISQNYETQKSRFANTIVQQGLVLNLDAGNPYSYAGSGATWYDASGTGNNGTLTNGPTYSGMNGGSIIFDGVDDYVNCGNLGSFYSQGTISYWMYSTAVENYRNPFSTNYLGGNVGIRFEQYTTASPYGGFSVIIGNDAGTYTGFSYSPNNILTVNSWYNVVLIWNTATNNVIGYLNGDLKFNTSHTYWATTLSAIAIGNGFSSDRYFKGNISSVGIYNRALSAAEVSQNFNATKGRFGL